MNKCCTDTSALLAGVTTCLRLDVRAYEAMSSLQACHANGREAITNQRFPWPFANKWTKQKYCSFQCLITGRVVYY